MIWSNRDKQKSTGTDSPDSDKAKNNVRPSA